MTKTRPAADPAVALALRRMLGDYARCPRPIAALPADVDPGACIRLAEILGVATLLHRTEAGALPAEVRENLRRKALEQGARHLRALAAATVFFRIFEEAGIPAAAMRGLVLAHRDYASPEERVMGDVDLLLPPASRKPALAALAAAELHPFARLRSQDLFSLHNTVFELHWRLLSAKRYRDCVDEAAWLACRRPLPAPVHAPEGRLYTLAPEHECLGLVLHAFAHHELGMFRQLLDIALFLCRNDLDWAAMARWCREARVSRLFTLTFTLTDTLFLLEAEAWRRHFPPEAGLFSPEAWMRPFFGGAGLADAWTRKRALVRVAETPLRRLRQLLYFFSWDAAQQAFRRRQGRWR